MKKFCLVIIPILLLAGCNQANLDKENYEKAIELKDESYCDKITFEGSNSDSDNFFPRQITQGAKGGFTFDYSRRTCLNELANLKNDPVICKKIKPYKNFINLCINRVARYNGNTLACEIMVGEDQGMYRDICYTELAGYFNDSAYCSNISNAFSVVSRETCLSSLQST